MPMPNRNVEGQYRYAYQRQEKDPETGMEAFELRLWDARIGGWLSPDPYGIQNIPAREIPFSKGLDIIESGGNPGYLKYIKY